MHKNKKKKKKNSNVRNHEWTKLERNYDWMNEWMKPYYKSNQTTWNHMLQDHQTAVSTFGNKTNKTLWTQKREESKEKKKKEKKTT